MRGLFGAGGGGRTRTVSLPPDFESGTSANSITPAFGRDAYSIARKIKKIKMQEKFSFPDTKAKKIGAVGRLADRAYPI